MVHVNETIVIKSSSPKLAEWVKRLKAHKAEQLEKLRNVEKCDFELSSDASQYVIPAPLILPDNFL